MRDSTREEIFRAVQYAVHDGAQPEEVVREVWSSWQQVLDEDRKHIDDYFKRMFAPRYS